MRSRVRVWEDWVDAVDQGDEAAAWLSDVLGIASARLVRMPDDAVRQCSQKYAPRGSQTAYSDGYPVLLASEASLSELNQRLTARGKPSLPMNRFRPNLVVGDGAARDGTPRSVLAPFAEDEWSEVAVASAAAGREVRFGVVKPCARCKMPTIDQATGVADRGAGGDAGCGGSTAAGGADDGDDEGGGPAAEAEPTATLLSFRSGRALGFAKRGWAKDVFFGQNLVLCSGTAYASVAVGDELHATPRRPVGWLHKGVRGVHYA